MKNKKKKKNRKIKKGMEKEGVIGKYSDETYRARKVLV